MDKAQLIKRIYKTQIKKYIPDLIIVVLFMILHGAATAAVAWLLDPAIKKIFLEKDQVMLFLRFLFKFISFNLNSDSSFNCP